MAVEVVVDNLKKMSKQVSTPEEIAQVCWYARMERNCGNSSILFKVMLKLVDRKLVFIPLRRKVGFTMFDKHVLFICHLCSGGNNFCQWRQGHWESDCRCHEESWKRWGHNCEGRHFYYCLR